VSATCPQVSSERHRAGAGLCRIRVNLHLTFMPGIGKLTACGKLYERQEKGWGTIRAMMITRKSGNGHHNTRPCGADDQNALMVSWLDLRSPEQ
jgi:hypothetical protein